MVDAVIVEAVRTPFARVRGAYRDVRPDSLLAHALSGLVGRAGVATDKIDDVITGCVSQVGEQGANVSRLGALLAGFPVTVPAVSVNRWCGSSQQAVHLAAQAIAAGDATCCIAAGVESMTRVPIYSDIGGIDKLSPAACERFGLVHQAESGERIAERWKISRADCDQLGMESQRRAFRAATERRHAELIPTTGKDSDGRIVDLVRDEGIRDTVDEARIASLKPAFRPIGKGVLSAANSSQFADGAAALLIADREWAQAEGLRPRARFRARIAVGDDPAIALLGVIPATRKALARSGLTVADLDWIEFNEAFAPVVLAWAREVGANLEKVNPWGGAIAHGHAVGATGAGLMAKMLAGLEATGGTLGLQVMTIGHGQATATVIERL